MGTEGQGRRKEPAIPAVVSLHEASRRLGQDRRYIKGLIHGLGIETQEVGTAIAIPEADIERLRERILDRARADRGPAATP